MELKSKIVAFLNNDQRPTVYQRLTRTGVYEESIRMLKKPLAQKEVLEPDSIWRRSVRYMQEQIGGGPAEFIADIEGMNEEQSLLVVDTDDLNPSQIRHTENAVKEFDLMGGKYFGQFSVEHITESRNHREEMPVIAKDA